MVRTLTWVTLLALLAGLALGFFVAEARATTDPVGVAARPDPVIEKKVALYVARYGLDEGEAREVRAALVEYDRSLLDLLRKLRGSHKDDFKRLSDRADQRIDGVLKGKDR
jgi:hypothetical protein